MKSQICDNVALYAQKYDEEFSPQLPAFVTAIWNLLISTGLQVKYDDVSEIIKLSLDIVSRSQYSVKYAYYKVKGMNNFDSS